MDISTARLILEDGSSFEGISFGYEESVEGEVVFSTGMVGYPESLTDPSYAGQILVSTYPLSGNYGVFDKQWFESDRIHVTGLIVSSYIDTPSHFLSTKTLSQWLKEERIPGLEIKDTRALTLKLREKGVMLGKIQFENPHFVPSQIGTTRGRPSKKLSTMHYELQTNFYDPNVENLVAKVSTKEIIVEGEPSFAKASEGRPSEWEGKRKKTVVLIDCGAKRNIRRCLLRRGVKVITVPWDYDPFAEKLKFDALVISNGPGDPKMADQTIAVVKKALAKKIPTFGICLGNQILALAAGGDTYKLKFGHRSQNQPCLQVGTKRCYLTTQNHGFAVGVIPKGFKPWFINANDHTNEGIIHTKLPFMSVQFHPEAAAGPTDTEWLFDYFLQRLP